MWCEVDVNIIEFTFVHRGTRLKTMTLTQSIMRSLLLGARSRSALLTRKRSGAPVLAPPIKLERAHFCAPLLILD